MHVESFKRNRRTGGGKGRREAGREGGRREGGSGPPHGDFVPKVVPTWNFQDKDPPPRRTPGRSSAAFFFFLPVDLPGEARPPEEGGAGLAATRREYPSCAGVRRGAVLAEYTLWKPIPVRKRTPQPPSSV